MRTRSIRLFVALGALLAWGICAAEAYAAETVRVGDYEVTLPAGFEVKFDSECAPSGG